MSKSGPLFEPAIIPLVGADPLERPAPGKPGPVPGLYHAAPGAGSILIYVPGGITGAPMSGRHDYTALAAALAGVGSSLLVIQALTAQRPAFLGFATCRNDIDACVAWAREQGYSRLALAGNGLGATRAVCWASAQTDDDTIPLLLISAFESPYHAALRSGTAAEREEREHLLEHCRALTTQGRSQDVVDIALPSGRRAMAAAAVLDYFGAPEEANTILSRYAEGVRAPVCLIHGDSDPYLSTADVDAVAASLASAAALTVRRIGAGGHELLVETTSIAPTIDCIAEWMAAA